MAAPQLVESERNNGMDVAQALWKDPVLKPTALMWFYDEGAAEWRYLVATEDSRNRGPKAAYLRVRNLLKKAELLDKLPLRRVVVADPSSPLVATLGSVINTPTNELAGLSFYNCTFNGLAVEGMHIYYLNDPVPKTSTKTQATKSAATSG